MRGVWFQIREKDTQIVKYWQNTIIFKTILFFSTSLIPDLAKVGFIIGIGEIEMRPLHPLNVIIVISGETVLKRQIKRRQYGVYTTTAGHKKEVKLCVYKKTFYLAFTYQQSIRTR